MASLETMAQTGLWPTPTKGDAKAAGSRNTASSKAHPGISLTDAVRGDGGTGRAFPTPTANRWDGLQSHGVNVVSGQLNPTWVEWLMGWPIGATDLRPLATDKFRPWCELHGIYSAPGSQTDV
jgi:hypothetical protein